MLARRLIYGQYVSMDAEEAMINRLKVSKWNKRANFPPVPTIMLTIKYTCSNDRIYSESRSNEVVYSVGGKVGVKPQFGQTQHIHDKVGICSAGL